MHLRPRRWLRIRPRAGHRARMCTSHPHRMPSRTLGSRSSIVQRNRHQAIRLRSRRDSRSRCSRAEDHSRRRVKSRECNRCEESGDSRLETSRGQPDSRDGSRSRKSQGKTPRRYSLVPPSPGRTRRRTVPPMMRPLHRRGTVIPIRWWRLLAKHSLEQERGEPRPRRGYELGCCAWTVRGFRRPLQSQ